MRRSESGNDLSHRLKESGDLFVGREGDGHCFWEFPRNNPGGSYLTEDKALLQNYIEDELKGKRPRMAREATLFRRDNAVSHDHCRNGKIVRFGLQIGSSSTLSLELNPLRLHPTLKL